MRLTGGNARALLIALLLPALASCGSDRVQGPDKATLSRVPTLAASDSTLQLAQLDFRNTALELSWTPGSNHGTNAAIDYSIEFDTSAAGSFAAPVVVPVGRGVYTKAWTVGGLNAFLTDTLRVAAGATGTVRVRVASMPAVPDAAPDYSNVIELSATPYEPVSSTLYLVGSAAPNGWSADQATALTPDADLPFVFTWEGTLVAGDFKLITTLGQFLPSYNRGATDSTLVYRTADTEPDSAFHVAETGPYRVTVNLAALTISLEKQEGPPYDQLWVIGDAAPNGWSLDNAAEMRQDPADPFKFHYNEVLNVGEFKIATAKDFAAPFYRPTTDHPALPTSDVQLSAGDPDTKWYIPEAGAYKITLDVRSMTISIVKFNPYTQLWMVGDATPAGWNIDAPTAMTPDPANPYVFTYSGQLKAGEFKFPVATGDWGTDYFMPAVNHQPLDSTAAPFVKGGQPDNKWQITTPGSYSITLNTLYETILIQQQ